MQRVSDDRLGTIRLKLQFAGKGNKEATWVEVTDTGKVVCSIAELNSLIAEVVRRRHPPAKPNAGAYPLGPVSKALMALEVGDTITLPPTTSGALTSARTTAKKHLQAPNATWHSQTLDTGNVLVTRVPDGTPYPGKERNNEVANHLSKMRIGQSKVITGCPRRIPNAAKVHARRLMGISWANWSYIKLINGSLRCTRTS
ncbi:hypothetical protein UFOVP1288_15 [uncultured Caudovirales phage]|uniref:Uncharacterized protein n=1 Tax=uncultured Caudovirales phage TaxID=2100421 RepID=A0A6J5RHC5_9CAUD|nr:hypothetical protein UFOVP1195_15 [uncultured Caudovirales phage]CAB4195432.1 hypothetical protein UFOVP1288_15 [uncultured Caudovirales phage]CAB4204916.1 hypothetical protein UFOVP1409_15 [uncultured Caudovirales phage]